MFEALVARVRYHIQKANFMGLKDAESTLLLAEAADAIEELSHENESLAKSVNEASEILRKRWIPVTERFPDECGKYLTAYSDGYVTENEWCFIGLTAVGWSYDRDAVTHWMPLPDPPKEDEVRV